METETYRPARLILLGEGASPELRRSTSLDALVTPGSPPFFIWHTARTSSPGGSPSSSTPALVSTQDPWSINSLSSRI
jgi:hypothetical protein